MKQLITFILLLTLGVSTHAQYSQEEIKQKCDSILQEANTLYRYEKAAWVFTDMFLAQPDIKNEYSNYLVYQHEDSIKCIVINKQNQSIYEVVFTDQDTPQVERFLTRDLTKREARLIEMKVKLINGAINTKYIAMYEGYRPNFVLLPYEDKYKLYVISGTSIPETIPFGNDYLFIANKDGEILSKKKFHSRLIPVKINPAYDIISHSHLIEEPFISATDICTFRLYAGKSHITEMSVLSKVLPLYFVYHPKTNTITIKEETSH